ncbi:MAG: sulfotransferase [Sphingomicrobium sp.]
MTTNPTTTVEAAAAGGVEELIATDPRAAADQLRERLGDEPFDANAYRLLARALQAIEAEDTGGAIRTRVQAVDPLLNRAAQALSADDLETAEIILRRRLLEQPRDVIALHLMAGLASALDFDDEADDLLQLVIELAPEFTPARVARASSLKKRNRPLEAAEALDPVFERDPNNTVAKALKASVLGRAGRFDDSLKLYEELLQAIGEDPKLLSNYGHMLKTVGRSDEGYRAMRRAIDVAPHHGEAWWTLSNLKTVRFEAADMAAMTAALERPGASNDDRVHLHFALGKAHEDAGNFDKAFAHYERGNAIRAQSQSYAAAAISAEVTASTQFFTREFFEERNGQGAAAADPIFILGMPRAGSTLVEQILASHSLVEGTMELPDIAMIAKDLGRPGADYLPTIAQLDAARLRELGEQYLRRTRVHRLTSRPFFVDKMPNNWLHVPLIHLILPNAKIIDARRHPLACGFSNFKQLYVEGHAFSYDLTMIGSYYSEYVRLLAHVDRVLPGRVHRVIHERLVDDTETEIRRMLDYAGLPFEPACLRFYETERAVRTPSSEQVRRPISREGVDAWRSFEPWLGPLKQALGPVLDAYPDPPDFGSN